MIKISGITFFAGAVVAVAAALGGCGSSSSSVRSNNTAIGAARVNRAGEDRRLRLGSRLHRGHVCCVKGAPGVATVNDAGVVIGTDAGAVVAPPIDAGSTPDSGIAVEAAPPPRVSDLGESCSATSDCAAGLVCVPAVSAVSGGTCDLASFGIKATGKTCSGECNTGADCCELPLNVTINAVAIHTCQDILNSVLTGNTTQCTQAPTPTARTSASSASSTRPTARPARPEQRVELHEQPAASTTLRARTAASRPTAAPTRRGPVAPFRRPRTATPATSKCKRAPALGICSAPPAIATARVRAMLRAPAAAAPALAPTRPATSSAARISTAARATPATRRRTSAREPPSARSTPTAPFRPGSSRRSASAERASFRAHRIASAAVRASWRARRPTHERYFRGSVCGADGFCDDLGCATDADCQELGSNMNPGSNGTVHLFCVTKAARADADGPAPRFVRPTGTGSRSWRSSSGRASTATGLESSRRARSRRSTPTRSMKGRGRRARGATVSSSAIRRACCRPWRASLPDRWRSFTSTRPSRPAGTSPSRRRSKARPTTRLASPSRPIATRAELDAWLAWFDGASRMLSTSCLPTAVASTFTSTRTPRTTRRWCSTRSSAPARFQREIVWRIGWVSGFKVARPRLDPQSRHAPLLRQGRPAGDVPQGVHPVPARIRSPRRQASDASRGYPMEDVWNASVVDRMDSIQIMSFSGEKVGYPTQKNEALVSRVVRGSSNPGDLVLDFCVGSGTTAVVAEKLGRRWVACDASPIAVHATRKRLLRLAGPPAARRPIRDRRQRAERGDRRQRSERHEVARAPLAPRRDGLRASSARRVAVDGRSATIEARVVRPPRGEPVSVPLAPAWPTGRNGSTAGASTGTTAEGRWWRARAYLAIACAGRASRSRRHCTRTTDRAATWRWSRRSTCWAARATKRLEVEVA